MQVPNRHAAQFRGLRREKRVVCCLITVNHIGDQRPVEAGVSVPLLNPARVSVDVQSATFLPNRKRTVVEDKRLANISNDADVILAREWYQRMPAGKEASAVLSGASDRRSVVRNHALSLTVSISTPWCVAMIV